MNSSSVSESRRRKRYLMDLVPALDRPVSVAAVAARVCLPEDESLAYLRQWEAKGLIELL